MEIDARIIQMAQLIARKHGATVEIDVETRYMNFPTGNVSEQLCNDMMDLFWQYEC